MECKLTKEEIKNQLESILDSDNLPQTEQDIEQAIGALEDENLKFAYDLMLSASNKLKRLNQQVEEVKRHLSQLISE